MSKKDRRRAPIFILNPDEQTKLLDDFFERVSYFQHDEWVQQGLVVPDPDGGIYPEDLR
jgi:hypothetical protein